MTNKNAERQLSAPAAHLRRVFETAVEEVQQPDHAAPRLRYGAPIAVRRTSGLTSQPDDKQRALTAAARALAQLWKVPSPSFR
jgi:hypothetical protein